MRFEWRERGPGDFRRASARLGAFLLIGAGLAVPHVLGVSVCLFHRLTGWPCLTCGSSRAVERLLAGDPCGALALQPLFTVLFLLACSGCAIVAPLFLLSRRVLAVRLSPAERRYGCAGLLGLALLNWLYLLGRGV